MIDFNAKYLVPMSRLDKPENEEELVECTIKHTSKPFEMICTCEGYRSKGFYIEYFEYLLKKGYAKKIDRYVTYFEVTWKNTISGYSCIKSTAYAEKLTELVAEHDDLELIYRQWSDGVIEDGIIEKEDWKIG